MRQVIHATLAAIALTFTIASPSFSDAHPSTEEIFKGIADNKEYVRFGYFPELDIHYGVTCNRSFDIVLFVRVTPDGLQTWTDAISCQRGLALRDLDQNGIPEIRYFIQGGGSGTVGVSENYLSWPIGEDPGEGISFTIFMHTEGMQRIGESDDPVYMVWEEVAELPEDAVCDSITSCPVISEKVFCVESCTSPLDREVLENPAWPEFVQSQYDYDGTRLGNADAPPELAKIDLAPLAEGEPPPEISTERRQEFENFLEGL